MRDPNRLDGFYDELKTIHKNNFPDWRFGQLCSNFFGWLYEKHSVDLFYLEERHMMEYIKEYADRYGMR